MGKCKRDSHRGAMPDRRPGKTPDERYLWFLVYLVVGVISWIVSQVVGRWIFY